MQKRKAKIHHLKKIKAVILIGLIIGTYFLLTKSAFVHYYLSNPEQLKQLVLSFGILAPLAIIILQTFQTTISLIPSQITTIIAGFIFGPLWGLIYSLIGTFIGSAFVFTLSKKYGNKISHWFFDKKEIKHFHKLFRRNEARALFLTRIAPIFPNDLISFAAGLTDIKRKQFYFYSTLGFIVQIIILTYFGAELSTGKVSTPLIAVAIIVSLLFIILLFKSKIKKLLIDDIHKLERLFKR